MNRINITTRVIAVDMPSDESVSIRWKSYLTTVDKIEEKTGFDFSNVSKQTQAYFESKKDYDSTENEGGSQQTSETGNAAAFNTDTRLCLKSD